MHTADFLLIFAASLLLGSCQDATIDEDDAQVHNDVENALRAFSAGEAINCRNSINALYADSASLASNAQYSTRAIHADYTVHAERAMKAGQAFKAKRSKYSKFALFAYEADKIVKRSQMKLPQYDGPTIDKIDYSQFAMKRDNDSCHCGGKNEKACKNSNAAFKSKVAVEAVNCTNSLYAVKATKAGNAAYATLASHAETAGQSIVAEKAQKCKMAGKALKSVYAVLAEKAEFALKLRRNPNKPITPEENEHEHKEGGEKTKTTSKPQHDAREKTTAEPDHEHRREVFFHQDDDEMFDML